MAREKKTEEFEVEEETKIDLDESKKILNEMKQDPQLRKFLVPIPDFGIVACILAYRILKQLERK